MISWQAASTLRPCAKYLSISLCTCECASWTCLPAVSLDESLAAFELLPLLDRGRHGFHGLPFRGLCFHANLVASFTGRLRYAGRFSVSASRAYGLACRWKPIPEFLSPRVSISALPCWSALPCLSLGHKCRSSFSVYSGCFI